MALGADDGVGVGSLVLAGLGGWGLSGPVGRGDVSVFFVER